MPCFDPRHGYKSRSVNKSTGKRSIVYNPHEGFKDLPISHPCGQCVGCRLERSRQWAIRCVHEAKMHEHNCFITLTYAPEHIPAMSLIDTRQTRTTLVKKHFQDFMKRLRIKFSAPERNEFGLVQEGIRYYMCGEYGDKHDRPHYHALLFNFRFPDQKLWKSYRGSSYYRSETLESLWPFGHSAIGEANFETAAYISRYILKKQLGRSALDHYTTSTPMGEVLHERLPEYTDMSRRGGIGKEWFEKFTSDVFPVDAVIIREREMRPPKYYDRLFEKSHPEEMRAIKNRRVDVAKKFEANNTAERLRVRERKKHLDIKRMQRSYENET